MNSAGDPEKVTSIIASIKQFKGFKQMAQYNISCLLTHITPPTVGWQENVRFAVESGGIESIIDILKQHPKALEVVRAAIEALRLLAVNSQNAGLMAKCGAIGAAVGAMKEGDDAVAESGAALMEQISSMNPEAVLDSAGSVEAILAAVKDGKKIKVNASCLSTLDRLARTERGEKHILKLGGISAVVGSMAPGKETTEDMLRPAFRILERFARDESNLKVLKEAGAIEALVAQLEVHAENETILRAGGRLLARIAESDLEATIAKLKDANLPPKVRDFLVTLISNLCLRPELIDRIIASGGIAAIIAGMKDFSPKTQEAAARALERMANTPDHINEIIKAGGVEALVKVLESAGDNDELRTAVIKALSALPYNKETAAIVDEKGAGAAVLTSLKKNPTLGGNVAAAIKFFEQLRKTDHDITPHVTNGLVKAMIDGMNANPLNDSLQVSAARTLEKLMKDTYSKSGKTGAMVAGELIGHKGVPTMLNAVSAHRKNADLVEASLGAFVELLNLSPKEASNEINKNVKALIAAIYEQSINGNRGIDDNAKRLIGKLVLPKQAGDVVALIKKHAGNVCSKKTEEEGEHLEEALMSVVAYSKVKSHADEMMKNHLVPVLLSTMHDIVSTKGVPNQDSLIANYAHAATSVAKADRKYLDELLKENAVKSMLEPIKSLPEHPDAFIPCLGTLRALASSPAGKKAVAEGGGIEGAVGIMRVNPNSDAAFVASAEVLLQLSTQDDLAGQVAHRGGTRQLIRGLMDNFTSETWEKPAEVSLMCLERVAGCQAEHKAKEALIKQGCIEAVIKTMESFPRNEVIEAVGARILAKLLDKAAVAEMIDRMAAAAADLAKTKDAKKLPDLSRLMATVGYLALSPDNVGIIKERNAPGHILSALKTLELLPDSQDKQQARRAGLRALGQIASTQPLDPSLGAVPYVLKMLREPENKVSTMEKIAILESIKSMAASERAALELVQGGAVKDILDLLKKYPHNEEIAAAAFGALGVLAEHEFGAKEITKQGGPALVQRWLQDNADTAGARAIEEALTLLSNLAMLNENAKLFHNSNIMDHVLASLDNLCLDPNNPQPRVLNAAVTFLGRLAVDEESIRKLAKTGAIKRVIDIAKSHPMYLKDPDLMESLLFLLESCGFVDDVRKMLVHDGAVDLIMAAMNFNATNEEIMLTGGRALQALLGSSPETMRELLGDVQALVDKLKSNPHDADTQEKLAQALQNLANLTVVDGIINDKNSKEVADALMKVIETLDKSLPEGPVKSRLIAQAANALGRLPLISGVVMDMDKGIDVLLKTMANNPNDEMITESCLNALGNMLNSPRALQTLASLNGIAAIVKAMDDFPDSERVRQAGNQVLSKARGIAEENPGLFGNNLAGLAALMKAHAGDSKALRDLMNKLAQGKGFNDLLSMLGSKDMTPEMLDALLKALNQAAANSPMEFTLTNDNQLKAILEMLKPIDPNLSAADRAAALERQKNLVKLLGRMDPKGLRDLMAKGGLEALLQMMMDNSGDKDLVHNLLDLLSKMFDADPNEALRRLMAAGGAEKLKQIIKEHEDDPAIVQAALNLLKKMAKIGGIDKIGIDDELARLLNRLNDKFGLDNKNKDFFSDLKNNFREDGPEMIGARLDEAMLKLAKDADNIVAVTGEDGRVYYYNKTTGETSWEKPKAYAQMIAAYEGLAKLTEANKDNVSAVNPKALNMAVGEFKNHANEPSRLTALAKALAILASNSENRAAIAAAGGLQAIIQALNGDNVDADFLDAALALLNQFAKEDGFKDQIATLGGIRALIKIMLKFIGHQIVVEKCLSTLTNLCYNSQVNIAEVMKCEGVPAVSKVMAKYKQESGVLTLAMLLLSNLMFGHENNRHIIGQQCGQDIVDVISNHYKEKKAFKGALRAVGNLTQSDENIVLVCNMKCTKHIVAGMDANMNDSEGLQLSIDVIGNFATLSEDDPAIQKKIARGELQSVFDIIMLEGGGAKILDVIKASEDPAVIMSGMDALANLCNDSRAADRLIKLGVVDMAISALQKYDWDESIVERTVHLIATLTDSADAIKRIVDLGGIPILLSAMESHSKDPEFLINAVIALKKIAGSAEAYRNSIGQLKGVDTTLSIMEQNLDQKPLLMEIILLLVRMSMTETISEEIAQKGMHVILKTIHQRQNDAEYLTQAFILLAHLAFAHSNLKIIVQYGGIALVIDAICTHPDRKDLIVRSIQTLDNVAMASPEHAKIVIEAGGEKTIKEVMKAYSDNAEITQCAKSALLSMTTLETRAARPRRQFLGQMEKDDVEGDPIAEFRNMLKAGAVMTEWGQGGPYSRHLYLMPDWRGLGWKDPKNKTGKGGSQIALRDIRVIRSGVAGGHKRGRSKYKDASCCFSIVGRAAEIDFETKTPEQCQQWVKALQALVHCFKKDPQWLRG